MTAKLTRQQLKILRKNISPDGWEYFCDCPTCQYMKRMDFAGEKSSFSELKEAFENAVRLGDIAGDEIDLKLLEEDLKHMRDEEIKL